MVATNGDTHLGGEDFDQRVMEHFIKLYKKKKGKDLRKDARAVQKLRREVEKAKRALSAAHQVRVEVESSDGLGTSKSLLGLAMVPVAAPAPNEGFGADPNEG